MRVRTNEHPEHAYLTAGDPGALHVVGCMQNDCPLINLPFQWSIDRSRQVGGGGRDSFVLLGLCENHVGL